MVGHFALRVVALIVIAMGLTLLFSRLNIHKDVTSEQLTALSEHTEEVLDNLEPQRPVEIEAFISPEVPESYEPTRLNLISMLQELEGENVIVRLNDTELFSEEAARAQTRYGIEPRTVVSRTRGTWSEDRIFMGVAFKSGLEKVIVPFVDRGIPVEYELVRSIATVSQQKRKKIGVIRTDAQLYGQFNMQTMSPPENWPIINELEKQYEVEEVDPTSPIVEEYDALLAVQPSSLGPDEMGNFVDAVRSGVPTAIFEDPFPYFARSVPATLAPRRPPGGMNPMMMQMQQQSLPKGDIQSLWSLLGVEFGGDQIVWQNYNPVPKLSELDEEFVFVDEGCKADEPFNERSRISSGLQHMLFPFPGWVSGMNTSQLDFEALVRTGPNSGTVAYYEMMSAGLFGMMGGLNPNRSRVIGGMEYVLAARIEGDAPAGLSDSEEGNGNGDGDDPQTDDSDVSDSEEAEESTEDETETSAGKDSEINVVLVADIDMLHNAFFRIREMGEVPEAEMHLDFDNVTFVLNVLDDLAGEDRFIDIRKRRRQHRTLTGIEQATEEARKKTTRAREDTQKEFENIEDEENDKFQDRLKKIEDQLKEGNKKLDLAEIARRVEMAREVGEKQMKARVDRAEKERDQKIDQIEKELALQVRRVQDNYKMWAVLIPPIPPLIVAVIVFLTRRVREREGVARTRLRG
jgi:ABC-2 type transport system permease protein